MAKIWQPQPFEILQSWLDAIIDEASDKLSNWETGFIENISDRVAHKWPLTQRQEEILEKIYSEKTS